jgi:hypothetical protein
LLGRHRRSIGFQPGPTFFLSEPPKNKEVNVYYATGPLIAVAICCGLTYSVPAASPWNNHQPYGTPLYNHQPQYTPQPALHAESLQPSNSATQNPLLLSTWIRDDSEPVSSDVEESEKWAFVQYTSSRWWVQADALVWDRIGSGCDRVLAVDLDSGVPGPDTVLSTSDLGFSWEPGYRVLVGYRPDPCRTKGCCYSWEFSYFGINGWTGSGVAVGDQNLAIPGILGLSSNNFLFADEIRAVYRSRLHSVEANCIKSCCSDCLTQLDFLLGFRFIALNEDFSLIGTDLMEGTSSYDISTNNYLYGLQMGGRMTRWMGPWALQVSGKAGLLLNDAGQRQTVTDFPEDFPTRQVSRVSGNSAAMLGEVDLTLVRRITDMWSVRVGYNVLGLGGLALAPDQLDFTVTPTSGTGLATNGFALYHGAHVGLEALW